MRFLGTLRNWLTEALNLEPSRPTRTKMWKVKAQNERERLRNTLQCEFRCARVAKNAQKSAAIQEKLEILGHSKRVDTQPGYIYLEIPELVLWLVRKNDGALEKLVDSVAVAAQAQLMEVIGHEIR